MKTTDYSNYKLGRFFGIVIFLALIALLIWPYFKAEYNTQKFSKSINTTSICKLEIPNQTVSGYKILNYSPESRSLEIYCFYLDSDFNNYVKLEIQGNNWKSVYSNRLTKEGYLYYPFYYY